MERAGELLTVSEAAKLLQVSPITVRRWANQRRIPCVRTPGNQRRFRRGDLEKVYAAEKAAS